MHGTFGFFCRENSSVSKITQPDDSVHLNFSLMCDSDSCKASHAHVVSMMRILKANLKLSTARYFCSETSKDLVVHICTGTSCTTYLTGSPKHVPNALHELCEGNLICFAPECLLMLAITRMDFKQPFQMEAEKLQNTDRRKEAAPEKCGTI